jgi:hypothetical protein
MSLLKGLKKKIKKSSKKLKRAVKPKSVYRVEKQFDSRMDSILSKYNAHIESKVRNKALRISPSSLRSQGIKAGNLMSKTSSAIMGEGRKIAKKVGAKEPYDFYNHLNPLHTTKDVGDVLQGKQSILQAGINQESFYATGMVHDSWKYDNWKRKKLTQGVKNLSSITNVSHPSNKVNISHGNGTVSAMHPIEHSGDSSQQKNKN